MNGSFLRFYVHEGHRHHHSLVWEWLLQQANKLGIRGGSAFKAMAGSGRHHNLNKANFLELEDAIATKIEFTRNDE
jgi:PII-like signaling protein